MGEEETPTEIDILIENVVDATIKGCMEWLKKETIIVSKETQVEITDSEITLIENSTKTIRDYASDVLKNEYEIIITNVTND